MHPWHEVDIGEKSPQIVNAIIEIPKFSKTKFEIDKKSGLLKVDRVLYSSVHYPANYGFIPQTLSQDGDPIDVLVIAPVAVVPGAVMKVTSLLPSIPYLGRICLSI